MGLFCVLFVGISLLPVVLSGKCSYSVKAGYALYGYNSIALTDSDVEDCMQRCDAEQDQCKSFDYQMNIRTCMLSSESDLTYPQLLGRHRDMDYYQKLTCSYYEVGADTDCRSSQKGRFYHGYLTKTVSGGTCQRWDAQNPHEHGQRVYGGENYCRNPDGEPFGPWCYTTDPFVRWEYCLVQSCEESCMEPSVCNHNPCFGQVCEFIPQARCSLVHCHGCQIQWVLDNQVVDCATPLTYITGCKNTERGLEYVGTVSTTHSGRTCQAWSSQSPHEHTYIDPNHPAFTSDGSVSLAENYCRNPENSPGGPWCYTTDRRKRWEYCSIPDCL